MNKNVLLNTKISLFKATNENSVVDNVTIGFMIDRFKSGYYKDEIEQVRKEDKATGDSITKRNLPTVAFHGLFDTFRKKDRFYEASGLIILDIDDVEDDLEEVKKDIMDSDDSVFAAMISPSGTGIKVLYYVQPDLVNSDNYRQI